MKIRRIQLEKAVPVIRVLGNCVSNQPESTRGLGRAWRQREVEAISSAEFRKALEDNHVILIGWRDIKKLT